MTYSKSFRRKYFGNNPDWVIGYTTREHLCIDLDNTSYPKVLQLAEMIMKYYPYVGDCVIMISSSRRFHQQINYTPPKGIRIQTVRNNYHIIFNNEMHYEKSCIIIETLAYLDVLDEAYIRIRMMRNDMTLRTNKTVLIDGTKPAPKFCAWIKNRFTQKEGKGIETYLSFYLLSNSL